MKYRRLVTAIPGFVVAVSTALFGAASGVANGSTVGSPSGSPVGSPSVVASSAPAPAPPLSTTAPAAAPSTPSDCHPRSDRGSCYQPGEYCRNSDHGKYGVACDGESIICEYNDGWRWEPA
jgi:hypothetical protein